MFFSSKQIVRGLRGILLNAPLLPGERAPAAAVAAAAAAAAGNSGLKTRAFTALWPALRALGRVPCLRDVGAELSRVVYHEVFTSLQVVYLGTWGFFSSHGVVCLVHVLLVPCVDVTAEIGLFLPGLV